MRAAFPQTPNKQQSAGGPIKRRVQKAIFFDFHGPNKNPRLSFARASGHGNFLAGASVARDHYYKLLNYFWGCKIRHRVRGTP